MAITAVGSVVANSGANTDTLAVSPVTVGDVLVFSFVSYGNTNSATVSGGGVTTWNTAYANSGSGSLFGLWWGVVTIAGSATITVTITNGGTINYLACQEFTTGGSTTWSIDGTAGSNYGSSFTSGVYPSKTSSQTVDEELYVGNLFSVVGGVGGSTSGFTYESYLSGYGQFCYSSSANTETAQVPAFTKTSGWGFITSMLLATTTVYVATPTGLLDFF
ncbi:MAG TPA: hypothetical protein VMR95_01760 [Candidatus Binatia bacterium]|nr:hypothetical protein [Candidatus Binatia bacterium]